MMMRMRLAWKKSQSSLDTSKYYIEIRPEAPGVRAMDLIPNYVIIGNCGLWKVFSDQMKQASVIYIDLFQYKINDMLDTAR